MPGVWLKMAALPVFFVAMCFFRSQKWQRKERHSQKAQGLETLWLLTSWDFEGRIVRKMGVVCEPVLRAFERRRLRMTQKKAKGKIPGQGQPIDASTDLFWRNNENFAEVFS